ncbi:uncharacterized protein LOC122648386, partial [Telopea speciosissima]|uniref:uncharacterized protein LOC122648386 n=1 Tax=Telopea speciosissima TaxID=54955 RepID=UPI001CC45AD4
PPYCEVCKTFGHGSHLCTPAPAPVEGEPTDPTVVAGEPSGPSPSAVAGGPLNQSPPNTVGAVPSAQQAVRTFRSPSRGRTRNRICHRNFRRKEADQLIQPSQQAFSTDLNRFSVLAADDDADESVPNSCPEKLSFDVISRSRSSMSKDSTHEPSVPGSPGASASAAAPISSTLAICSATATGPLPSLSSQGTPTAILPLVTKTVTAWVSPLGLGGDFNVIRFSHEKLGGDQLDLEAINSFNECIEDMGVNDLRWTGFPLTWCNKRAGSNRISCKLDRVMVNEEWLSAFPSSHANFDNPDISDHSPISLAIQPFPSFGPKPFKYFDMWASHPSFLTTVIQAWEKPVTAFSSPLITFSKKLKNVKAALKDLNSTTFGNISQQVLDCKDRVGSIQIRLQSDHCNGALADEEKVTSLELSSLLAREESFLKQKSRIKWLELGNSNSAYFHRSLKDKVNANSIVHLTAQDGSIVSTVKDIKDLAVQHFKGIFTSSQLSSPPIPNGLLNKLIPSTLLDSLSSIPNKDEIVAAIHSLKVSGAPGPDGFSMGFFLAAWDIIKLDLIAAIVSFFYNPYQVKGINHTFFYLIP